MHRVAESGDLAASPIHPLGVIGTEQKEAGQLLVNGSTAVAAPWRTSASGNGSLRLGILSSRPAAFLPLGAAVARATAFPLRARSVTRLRGG